MDANCIPAKFADCDDTVDVLCKIAWALDPKRTSPPSTGEMTHDRAAAWLVHTAAALHRAADVLLEPESDPLDEVIAHLHALLTKLLLPEVSRRQKELAHLPKELVERRAAGNAVKGMKRAADALSGVWELRREVERELAEGCAEPF